MTHPSPEEECTAGDSIKKNLSKSHLGGWLYWVATLFCYWRGYSSTPWWRIDRPFVQVAPHNPPAPSWSLHHVHQRQTWDHQRTYQDAKAVLCLQKGTVDKIEFFLQHIMEIQRFAWSTTDGHCRCLAYFDPKKYVLKPKLGVSHFYINHLNIFSNDVLKL